MQGLVLNHYNGPLELSEVPRPRPSAGQVLVRIAASGLNPLDMKIRSGSDEHAKHPVPLVLGIDLAGVVEELGPGVTVFQVSDEVYGMTGGVGGIQGSLAQYAAVDADLFALKPSRLTMREAAALPLAFITSYSGVVDRAHLRAGQTLIPWNSGNAAQTPLVQWFPIGPWRSLASALAWGARGPGFKSRRPDHFSPVKYLAFQSSAHAGMQVLPHLDYRGAVGWG